MKLQTRDAGTPCDDHGDPSGDETSMQQVWDIRADETLHEKLGFNGGRNIKKKKKRKESSETGKWEQNVFGQKTCWHWRERQNELLLAAPIQSATGNLHF